MKKMNLSRLMTLALITLTAAGATAARAQTDELFPNNTQTGVTSRLANTGPNSGVVDIRGGHYYRHYYGYNVVLDVQVVNRAYRKEIYLHQVDGRGHVTSTQKIPVVAGEQSYRPAAPFGRYQGKIAHYFDRFELVGHVTNLQGRYIVEVKMDGVSYWSGYVSIGSSSRI